MALPINPAWAAETAEPQKVLPLAGEVFKVDGRSAFVMLSLAEKAKKKPISATAVTLTNARCEYLADPLGIDVTKPRLSWVMEDRGQKSEDRRQRQTAYQVLVASSEELLKQDKGDLWDSGKVASDQSVHVEYSGKPLESQMLCYWKVKTWFTVGGSRVQESDWSQPALWSMGLLKPEDWSGAKWIGDDAPENIPSPLLRKSFVLNKAVKRALVYATAHGAYELYLNGKRVYLNYADTRLLREHYPALKKYITLIHGVNPNHLRLNMVNGSFPDWPDGSKGKVDGYPSGGSIPPEVFATAMYFDTVRSAAAIAAVIGETADATTYSTLTDDIRSAFNTAYVKPTGEIHGNSQAGYALALHFDLLPENLRPEAARRMNDLVVTTYGGRLSTGEHATPRLLVELSRRGFNETAWALMESTRYPSVGYMISHPRPHESGLLAPCSCFGRSDAFVTI